MKRKGEKKMGDVTVSVYPHHMIGCRRKNNYQKPPKDRPNVNGGL